MNKEELKEGFEKAGFFPFKIVPLDKTYCVDKPYIDFEIGSNLENEEMEFGSLLTANYVKSRFPNIRIVNDSDLVKNITLRVFETLLRKVKPAEIYSSKEIEKGEDDDIKYRRIVSLLRALANYVFQHGRVGSANWALMGRDVKEFVKDPVTAGINILDDSFLGDLVGLRDGIIILGRNDETNDSGISVIVDSDTLDDDYVSFFICSHPKAHLQYTSCKIVFK